MVVTVSSRIVDDTLRARVEAEYREMPGLSLTTAQARRLLGLDGDCCVQVLRALADAGFLRCGDDGKYCRNDGGDRCLWRRRESYREDIPAMSNDEDRTRRHQQEG